MCSLGTITGSILGGKVDLYKNSGKYTIIIIEKGGEGLPFNILTCFVLYLKKNINSLRNENLYLFNFFMAKFINSDT